MASGTYAVEVMDVNGCVYSTSATITNTSGPTAVATTVVNAACGASNGSITLGAVTGGVAPYTYSVDGSAFTATISYPNMTAGTYAVEVRDANNCTFSTTASISNTGGPTEIVTTLVNTTCGASNGSLTLGAVTDGVAPYTYSVDGSAFTATISYINLASGTYTIDVMDVNGCIFSTSVNITNTGGPTAIATTVVNAACGALNGSVTLGAVTGGVAPYTYSFDGGPFIATTSYTNLAPGTYSVEVMDVNGCVYSTSAGIANTSGPTAIATTVVNAACGASNGTLTLGVVTGGVGPFTYSVDVSAYTATTSYGNLSAGSHSIDVKDANGCIFSTTASINNTDGPTAIATTVVNAACAVSNGSITLGAVTGGVAPYTYSVDGSPFTATTSYPNMAAGTYAVEVSDANSCTFSTTASISNTGGPTAIVTTVVNTTCGASNGSITLGAVTGGAEPYTYSVDGSPFTAITSYPNMTAGTYAVEVSDANGCIFATSAIITNTGGPTAIVTNVTDANCGSLNGTLTIGIVTGGISPYTYSINGSAFTSTTNYTNLAAGTYIIVVRDANGCEYSSNATIADPATPGAPIIGSVTQPTCADATGEIILNGLPEGTWTVNPGAITGSGVSTTIPGLYAGTYNFTVTNATGCTSQVSSDVVITAFPGAPAAPIAGTVTQPICAVATGSVELTGLPDGVWAINPGSITGTGSGTTIPGLTAGIHNFTVTNAAGCISPVSADILITAFPGAPIAPTIGVITLPTCTVPTGSIELNGLPDGNWIINPGAISGTGATTTIPGLTVGTYNFTVTNSDGCISPLSASML